MALKYLQRLPFKNLGYSAIFVIVTIIIIVGIIDKSIIRLSIFDYKIQFDLSISILFIVITLFSLILQNILFIKIYKDNLQNFKKTQLRKLFYISFVCNFANIALLVILVTQISLESNYNKFLIVSIVWINTSIGIVILSLLTFKFILWLRESPNKNIIIISLLVSIWIYIILNLLILAYFSLGTQMAFLYITSTMESSVIFAPYTFLSVIINTLSIVSFVFFWISSLLLLVFSIQIRKKKYFFLIGISFIMFMSEYIFIWGFHSLMFTNFNLFHDIFNILSNNNFQFGGIIAGLVFWILARNIEISNIKNDYKININNIKKALYLTAIGLTLIISSHSPLDITKLPYPPFGLLSFSFINVGSFAFLIGIYTLAITISKNPIFQNKMKQESEFLFSIAESQESIKQKKLL